MQLDNPITTKDDDAFGRASMAERCARRLSAIESERAFVVGLSGEWGSGKTSFVNMVKEALIRENKQIVIVFNAWLYSSQEQLVRQFFSEVIRALKSDTAKAIDGAVREIGDKLEEYSDAFASTGTEAAKALIPGLMALNTAIPVTEKAQKGLLRVILQKTGAALKGPDKTVEQLRDDISKGLKKLNSNIVVIIDDVDRLSSDDIRSLFKLVNLTASFPHMTFLLSYDENVVREALSSVQAGAGKDYLEKIIQLPIELPQPRVDELRKMVEKGISEYVDTSSIHQNTDEAERFERILNMLVLDSIRTPRQLKRYFNKLDVMTVELGDEICATDLVGMAAILLFYPELAGWLWNNKNYICYSTRKTTQSDDVKLTAQLGDSLRSVIPPMHFASAIEGLDALFPVIGNWFAKAHEQHPFDYEPFVGRETGRVASLENLETVFCAVDGHKVRRSELLRLVNEADCLEIEERMVNWGTSEDLKRLLSAIWMYYSRLGKDRWVAICFALLGALGRIGQTGHWSTDSRDLVAEASRILFDLMGALGTDEADELIRERISSYGLQEYLGISWFLRKEMRCQSGDIGADPCLSPECFADLAKSYIATVVNCLREVLLLPEHPAKLLWMELDQSVAGNAREGVSAILKDDYSLKVLLAAAQLHRSSLLGRTEFSHPSKEKASVLSVSETKDSEVLKFTNESKFVYCNDDVKMRIAALYLLIESDKTAQNKLNQARSQYPTEDLPLESPNEIVVVNASVDEKQCRAALDSWGVSLKPI